MTTNNFNLDQNTISLDLDSLLSSNSAITVGGGTGSGAMFTYTFNNPQTNRTVVSADEVNASKIFLNGTDLGESLKLIQERLLILTPDPKKLEKFQALRQAYEHYKTLEALCQEDQPNDQDK